MDLLKVLVSHALFFIGMSMALIGAFTVPLSKEASYTGIFGIVFLVFGCYFLGRYDGIQFNKKEE